MLHGNVVSPLKQYWKYSDDEIRTSLLRIWNSSFPNNAPLPHELSEILYPILVQGEISTSIRGLIVEILLLSEVIPLPFSNNFQGRFCSYIQSGSWDCLRLLLSLETAEESLVVRNNPFLIDRLTQLSSDGQNLQSKPSNVVPAISHCLKYFPDTLTMGNCRSIIFAFERLLLSEIELLIAHNVERQRMDAQEDTVSISWCPSNSNAGFLIESVKLLLFKTAIPHTLIAIFFRFTDVFLEILFDNAAPIHLKECAALITDIIQVLKGIAIHSSECNTRVLAFLSEIFMRFDTNISLSAFDAMLSLTAKLNCSVMEKFTQITCSTYTDPMTAHHIVKIVDRHFTKLQEMKWIEKWFPVLFKLACARPYCYTKFLIKCLTLRDKRTSSILISILNLPSICSTIEFSQLLERNEKMKHTFLSAVEKDIEILNVYTNLLKNSYSLESPDAINDVSRCMASDKSRMWLRESFRVYAISSSMTQLIDAYFESELALKANMRVSVCLAIENFSSWSTNQTQEVVSKWITKAFYHCPKLIAELQDAIRECILTYLHSEEQQTFICSLIYCIGECAIQNPGIIAYIADNYIDLLENIIVQLLDEHDYLLLVLPVYDPQRDSSSIPHRSCNRLFA